MSQKGLEHRGKNKMMNFMLIKVTGEKQITGGRFRTTAYN